jgi:hypothetical protein
MQNNCTYPFGFVNLQRLNNHLRICHPPNVTQAGIEDLDEHRPEDAMVLDLDASEFNDSQSNEVVEVNRPELTYEEARQYADNILLPHQSQLDSQTSPGNGQQVNQISTITVSELKNNLRESQSNFRQLITDRIFDLKSNVRVSERTRNHTIKCFEQINQTLFTSLFTTIDCIRQSEDKEALFEALLSSKNIFTNPFEFINSSYKQEQIAKKSQGYVQHEVVFLANRQERRYSSKTMKSKTRHFPEAFVYFDIQKTIEEVVKKKSYFDILEQFEPLKAYGDFIPSYSNQIFWSDKANLRLIFYADDLEPNNALGHSAGIYTITAFYFTILNLGPEQNSKLGNVFLLALAFSIDIRSYGMNTILNRIVKDIKVLETTGIKINDKITFRASIYQVAADNQGL